MRLSPWPPTVFVLTGFACFQQTTLADQPFPETILQSILETRFEPQKTETLLGVLRGTSLTAAELPIQVLPPLSSQRAFTHPQKYITMLSNFGAHQSTGKLTDPTAILERQIQRFTDEFPQKTSSCSFEQQALPESLEEAVRQIESYAHLSRSYYASSLKADQQLDPDWEPVIAALVKSPYGGNFDQSEKLTVERFFSVSSEIELGSLLCASVIWGQLVRQKWIERLQQLMAQHPLSDAPIILRKMTPMGEIILAGSAPTNIRSSHLLMAVDLGGNDHYSVDSLPQFPGTPQLILNFSGDDIYETSQPGGFASGAGRPAFLIDLKGDDQYNTKSQSLGTGILGVGMLIDAEGNDQYTSESMAQGMGLFGIGLLLDQSGNDSYLVQILGQGLGMTSGLGQLMDFRGNDQYLSRSELPTNYGTPGIMDSWVQGVGLGLREISAGGVGVLVDLEGRDTYEAMSFAQGGGYHHGLGVFLDGGEGNDSYLGARYNFGWGAHAGLGYFKEFGGDDLYHTRQIVAAGLAWDRSLALFHDQAGDDIYELGDFSLAATAHHSIAVFLDSAGADHYRGVQPAGSAKGPVNLSVFMDLGHEQDDFDAIDAESGCTLVDPFGYLILLPSTRDLLPDECRH
jgi:hypothetical protein